MKGRVNLKIHVKLNSGRSFRIPAPIALVRAALGFGGLGVFIARRYVPEDQRQYIDCIDFKELSKGLDVLKDYKGLKLVEVKAGDGTEVTIVI
jgi:hypothetical protein